MANLLFIKHNVPAYNKSTAKPRITGRPATPTGIDDTGSQGIRYHIFQILDILSFAPILSEYQITMLVRTGHT